MLKLKDFLTLLNAVLGLMALEAIVFPSQIPFLYFIIAAGIVDYFDGKVARKTNTHNEFGKQLDSLADAISFGLVPAFALLSTLHLDLFTALVSIFYLSSGLVRLAKFNVQEEKGVFYGLPIPVAALFSILSLYAAPTLFPTFPQSNLLPLIIYFICSVAMLSKFKIKKI